MEKVSVCHLPLVSPQNQTRCAELLTSVFSVEQGCDVILSIRHTVQPDFIMSILSILSAGCFSQSNFEPTLCSSLIFKGNT